MQSDPVALAAQSLALYRELRDELRWILPEIGAAETSSILAMDEGVARLRQAIQDADAALAVSPPQPEAGGNRLSRLLAERRQAMDEVLALYKEGIAQAESVKSLLTHDLAVMRAERQALEGYAPRGQDVLGGVINRQS